MSTTAAVGAQVGVCLVIQDWPQGWSVYSTRFHGPNVVSYKVITNRKRTPIIGAYLLPSTLEHLPDLEEALTLFLYQDPILVGDISANIGQSQNPRNQQVVDLLIARGLGLADIGAEVPYQYGLLVQE